MLNTIKRLWKEEEGASMVEYGILVALISVAAITVIASVGGSVNTAFDEVDTKMSNAVNGTG